MKTLISGWFISKLLFFHMLVHRCYEMERRLKTPDLFKFPYFEAICWYVAKNLLEMLKGESGFYVSDLSEK